MKDDFIWSQNAVTSSAGTAVEKMQFCFFIFSDPSGYKMEIKSDWIGWKSLKHSCVSNWDNQFFMQCIWVQLMCIVLMYPSGGHISFIGFWKGPTTKQILPTYAILRHYNKKGCELYLRHLNSKWLHKLHA